LKNIFGNRGVFFSGKKCPQTHHVLPRIHHELTIKTPQQNVPFSKKPPQKHQPASRKKNTGRPQGLGDLRVNRIVPECFSVAASTG
jgi:hypothetical protein